MFMIWLDKGGNLNHKWEFKSPDYIPVGGETYVVRDYFETKGGEEYEPGDELFIIERTTKAPWGITTNLGNLVVRGKNNVSVWSSIELCITNEIIKLKHNA